MPTQHDEAYWMNVFASQFDVFMRRAKHYFRDKPPAEREELASDALYLTWAMFRRRVRQGKGGEDMLHTCFYWSKRHARNGDTPKDTKTRDVYRALPGHLRRPVDAVVDAVSATRTWDDPAEIARVRFDMRRWLESLTPEQRERALQLAEGWRNKDIAGQWGVLPAAVSMQRLALRRSYQRFIG